MRQPKKKKVWKSKGQQQELQHHLLTQLKHKQRWHFHRNVEQHMSQCKLRDGSHCSGPYCTDDNRRMGWRSEEGELVKRKGMLLKWYNWKSTDLCVQRYLPLWMRNFGTCKWVRPNGGPFHCAVQVNQAWTNWNNVSMMFRTKLWKYSTRLFGRSVIRRTNE